MRTALLVLATLSLAPPLLAQTARPAGDPALGTRQFIQCRACHTVTRGGANTVGPNLWGIAGARAATRPGFAYSPALTKSGIVWTTAELDAFLTRPNARVPGTRMIFGGVKDPAARRNLIAYLATLKAR